MRRSNQIAMLQGVRVPQPVTGSATRLYEGEVVAIGAGTLDVRLRTGRSTKVGVRYPLWYVPALGDHVLMGDVQGDERTPIVITPLATKTNTAPAHT